MTKIEQAQAFAHKWHDFIGQKRKYSGQPYWVHTDEVALIVASVTDDEDMIMAAHGHDLDEDVLTALQSNYDAATVSGYLYEYGEVFNERARKFITELTDVYIKSAYPALNRKERHELENKRLEKISVEAKTIKMADLISNTRSIVADDKDFAQVYIREKLALLPLISDGSPILLQQITSQTIAACMDLGIHIPMLSA